LPDPRSKNGNRWTANRKTSVVLELLKGSNAVELARSNGISQNQLFEWRDRFLEAGKSELKLRRRKDPAEKEIGRLERKVGQLTLQVEILQEVARLKKTGRLD
jgi:transposase-like protein